MTELLRLCLTPTEIIAMVNKNPAELLRMSDGAGSRHVGREADTSLLSIESGRFKMFENSSVEGITEKLMSRAPSRRVVKRVDAGSPMIIPVVEA